ncbi:large lipid transfer protein-like [Tropilaelaps mercedesae]|uniref:Large lipid transfer protein-like n=1 Tax=Tropilaelaps mercedesae TaxID=418985 RepID=A0A1V9XCT9_9ACAR|nr:large lipid transfer protein-like [Tropilaelaps mercedesae]
MGNGGRSIAVLLGLGLLMLANAADIGKEYRYSYTGNMKYLATEMKSQNTRMAFRSNVRMQKIDDLNFALKIENLEMATVNERTAGCPERVNLTFAGDDRLSEMVEKPFIVAGLGKQFRQFETFALDPIWSVNLKKGLASLVNIFLPESDEPVYENHVSTIYGDCDAHWNRQYQPHWTNPEAKVVNLTRMVDYDKCTKIASWMHGSLPATPCVNCESVNTHPLSFSSSVTYSLVSPTGEHKDLHLETVDGRSTIMHAPNTENGNVVKLITTQRLQLEEVKDIAEKLDIHGDREIYKTLNMDFARETGFKRPIDMKKALGIVKDWELKPSVKTTIAMMKELTALRNDEAGNQVGMFDRKDPSKILGMVIEMMSMFDYEQTEAVFDAVVKDAPADQIIQMQRTFVEVTAAAGHNAGVQFVIDKIQSGEIDTRFISSFLMGIRTGLTDYTEVALNSILNFCRSDMMNKFEQERMKCMLAYTSMVSEVCRIASYAPIYGHPDCHQQKLQNKVFDKLIPDANTAVKETAENLRTYIHMAGNLKTHKAVEFLSAIIHDEAVEHFT